MQQDEDKIARLRMDATCAAQALFRLLLFLFAAVSEMSRSLEQIETSILFAGHVMFLFKTIFLAKRSYSGKL